jgi:phage shock protein A
MRGCWEFLRNTIRTQTEVITAYEYLISARDAFEQVESRAASDAIANFETVRGRADSRYQDVLGSTAEEASIIPPISASEYQQKVAQFEADIGVYTDLDDALEKFVEGTKWLGYAKSESEGENRNVKRALEQANEAEKRLRSARRELSDLIDSTGADTTLVPTLNELRSVATAKIEEAEEVGP